MGVEQQGPGAEELRRALAEAAQGLARDGADSLDAETVAALLAAAVVFFAAKTAAGEVLAPFASVPMLPEPSATDVCVTAAAMLDAVAVEVFELGLWKSLGGTGSLEPPATEGP